MNPKDINKRVPIEIEDNVKFWKGLCIAIGGSLIFYALAFLGGRYLASLNNFPVWKGMIVTSVLMIIIIVMLFGFTMYDKYETFRGG